MKRFKHVTISGMFLYRWPLFPARSIIRKNLNVLNYLKVSIINLRHFSFRSEYIGKKQIWVFDDWSDNYFHWNFDVLAKLFELRKLDDCRDILVPAKLMRSAYVEASLNALGYHITPLEENRRYRIKEVVSQENVNYYSKEILLQIKNAVLDTIKIDVSKPLQNIYISRSKAKRRKIDNEESLLNVLKKYDFITVFLEEMTWQDQVALFTRAKVVVAMHGAGLSNILYGEKMNGVIELRPSSSQNRLFKLLAEECNISYREVIITAPGSGIHDENFILGADSLEKIDACLKEYFVS